MLLQIQRNICIFLCGPHILFDGCIPSSYSPQLVFCCTLLYVHSSIAIILMGKRELIALLNLSSWCLVMVERLFLAVPRGCLQFVIVVFPNHTHLLFLKFQRRGLGISVISPSVRLTIHEKNVPTENSSSLKQLGEDIVAGKHSLKGVEITVNKKHKKKKFQSASQ